MEIHAEKATAELVKNGEKKLEPEKKEEKKEEVKAVTEFFEPIPLLPLITAAQNQNGLRHKEYQRYQGYCSRKLRK